MTKEELVEALMRLKQEQEKDGDYETSHIDADKLLLQFINDYDVTEVYQSIGKWYS